MCGGAAQGEGDGGARLCGAAGAEGASCGATGAATERIFYPKREKSLGKFVGENFINGEIAYSMVLRMLLLRAGVQ